MLEDNRGVSKYERWNPIDRCGERRPYRRYRARRFSTSDRFLQHLSNKILSALGEVAASYVESRIHSLDGFDVCEVVCKPSKIAVFLRSKSEEGNSMSVQDLAVTVSPLSKFLEYARTRFTT